MKVIMKNIETIAWFKNNEHPIPIRLRITDHEMGNIVIPIEHILFSEEERYAGNRMILYRCKSTINNIEKLFELKYEIDTCNWFLFKM